MRFLTIILCLCLVSPVWADIDFDGSDDLINLGTSGIGSDLNGATAITFMVWARKDSNQGDADFDAFFTVYIHGTEVGFAMYQGDSGGTEQLRVDARTVTGEAIEQNTVSWSATDPTLMVGIMDLTNDELSVSVDGGALDVDSVSFDNATYTHGVPTRADQLGADDAAGGSAQDITLLEVAIWKTELTQHEINQLYEGFQKNMPQQVQPDSLVAHYTLDVKGAGASADGETFVSLPSYPHVVVAEDNVHTDTTIKKFGTASLQFDGTNDYVSTIDHPDWTVGSEEFTIDFWLYFTYDSGAKSQYVFTHLDLSGSDAILIWLNTAEVLNFRYYVSGNTTSCATDGALLKDTWYHIACVREGDVGKIYVDGTVQTDTFTKSGAVDGCDEELRLGMVGGGTNANWYEGYMDEIRFSRGIARWTGNFTPPTVPHTSDEYTVLLLHGDGSDSGTVITDERGYRGNNGTGDDGAGNDNLGGYGSLFLSYP
jgi:hypothetical protein|tara:strand:+ start:947 stop:2398 length:1452 start_codon:yes stop_codon:yes gene_type:complete